MKGRRRYCVAREKLDRYSVIKILLKDYISLTSVHLVQQFSDSFHNKYGPCTTISTSSLLSKNFGIIEMSSVATQYKAAIV